MPKWNEHYHIGLALDPSKGAYATVQYTVGPYDTGEVMATALPNMDGGIWGGTWSFVPEEVGFPNQTKVWWGTRIRRYYSVMGGVMAVQENREGFSITRVSEADAIRYCATDGRDYDPATGLCTGEPTPPPDEDEEPPPTDGEDLPWPLNVFVNALGLVFGPLLDWFFDRLKERFGPPLDYLKAIADGILKLPETLEKIRKAISDILADPWGKLWQPLVDKWNESAEEVMPKLQDGFRWVFNLLPIVAKSTFDLLIQYLGWKLTPDDEERPFKYEPPPTVKAGAGFFGGVAVEMARGILSDFGEFAKATVPIAEGATTKGTPEWKKDLEDAVKPFADDTVKSLMDSFKFEEKLKSPMTDEEAKDIAAGIGSTAVGVSIAIWIANLAAQAATGGQHKWVKDFDDQVIAKLGLAGLGAKVISIPLERGVFKPAEYFYNTLLTPEIPAYADLINMVVKEVLELDDFKKQMGRLGYSGDWSQKIWDAHFIPPTRTELLRAHWRGKLSAEAITKLELLVDLDPRFTKINSETGEIPLTLEAGGGGDFNIWEDLRYIDPSREEIRYMWETGAIESEEEYTEYLRRLGYRTEDLEKLVNYGVRFQERFFRRRYLIVLGQGYRLGTVTEEELRAGYKEAHYTDAVADWVIKAEEVRQGFRGGSIEREATLARAINWYVKGFIEESDLKERLEGLGYAETEVNLFIEEANAKIEPPEEEEAAKVLLFSRPQLDSLLKDQTITTESYRARMLEMGWKEDTINEWLKHLEAPEAEVEARDITTSRVLNWFKKDVLGESETRDRLTVLKYAPDDIELLINEANLSKVEPQKDILQGEAASAFRVGAIDETEFRLRLSKLGRTPEAIDLIIATETLKQEVSTKDFSRGQWDRLFRSGIITENEYRSRLGLLGYTGDGIEYWVSLQLAEQFEKAKTLTQGQIIDVWEKGQTDLEWFGRAVLGMVTGEPVTIEKLEEWTITRLKGLGMPEVDARILLELEREVPKEE